MSDAEPFDILIVGAGAAGLTAGLALSRAGWSVTIVGKPDTRPSARTVALLDGSLRLLGNLGLLDVLRPHFAALETMRIVDDTDSLFRGPPVDFRATEIGLDLFGENIENATLVEELARVVRAEPGLTLVDSMAQRVDLRDAAGHVTLDDGRILSGRLLVAADGRKSRVRAAARIATREWSYPQIALTAILQHDRPHRDTSTEFHTRQGPFTLVPLPGRPDAPFRSSLVWMMDPREARRRQALDDALLAREMERQAHSMLGHFRLEAARGAYPMSGLSASTLAARRVVLVGDAAHGFPPIGAQGLNLGLRDVAHLVDSLEPDTDPGGDETLARYDAARQTDVRTRTLGVDMLNRSLLTGLMPVDALRGIGLMVLANFAPLRRMVMREGVMPRGRVPSLMRAQGASRL